MAKDPGIVAHQQWLGYVQPTGLVVSIPALLEANARLNQNIAPDHRRFLEALPGDSNGEVIPQIGNFVDFATAVFGWTLQDLCGATAEDPIPASLEANLENYNETLRPTFALRDFQPSDPSKPWILLVSVLGNGTNFDEIGELDSHQWQASPQVRFERLLRQLGVPIGLLVNGSQVRLVYAPEKELSGYLTFKLAEMVQVAGRPIFAAFHMLFCAERLFSVAEKERLPAILANSRKYQNVVSTQLAEQVVEALYEFLRGFQAADDQSRGELLRDVLGRDPDHVYHGLLTVLLRLVFLLFAEDRGLLSTDPLYANHYSVTGLYDRLREDNGRYPDVMDRRFGAWARLLVLFRLIYSGGSHGAMKIPPREGYLFDPDRYLFLEGRKDKKDKPVIPRVSDGVIFRVLSKLMLLDGERLSYRTLAVEQIGSVYQAIMGFSLQVATGRSIAIKPAKRHGAPATIDLERLLSTPSEKRSKWFTDETDQKLTGQAADALKSAQTVDELLVALERKIASNVTPMPVPKDAMVFQPSDERRKSGSHYTPSSLTAPIVEATLQPVLEQLGPKPTPVQILNLKVCDLAMGSAAFLVEACRQLGDALSKAWHSHNEVPSIPLDEDETLYAQRMIAQRCLYGLDKNPMAADLAKLSLWLATLAKDHPFTFLDHSLRHGDALVGLTRKQIASFNWAPSAQQSFLEEKIRHLVEFVSRQRREILEARENTPYAQLEQEFAIVEGKLGLARMIGDAAVAAFFSTEKPKQREEARKRLLACIEADLKEQGFISVDGEVDRAIRALRKGPKGGTPFHWELEFPEVFTTDERENIHRGFDVIVGNPPFMGGTKISVANSESYRDWILAQHEDSHGNADLVAHFFRRAFELLRQNGCFGLIATNTIGQGDTRSTGLRWVCTHGGTIYQARKRLKWPGEAAVVVSVVHVAKGLLSGPYLLDNHQVPLINAYLFHSGNSEDPNPLRVNQGKSFKGSDIYGMGFTFDDEGRDGAPSPISEMHRLIARNPHNAERIYPFIGGEEINQDPTQAHRRYIINFGELDEGQCRQRWPDLMKIVEEKVRPERMALRDSNSSESRKKRWWLFSRPTTALYDSIRNLDRVIALSRVGQQGAFAFLPTGMVYGDSVVVFALSSCAAFCALQSRPHEVWARFFASSMKDDLRYTPSDCFETFPFPGEFETLPTLEQAGHDYCEFRASLMVKNNEGLTATYNRFHNPDEDDPDIVRLRDLHDTMDRAVLDVYGWTDIQPKREFLLDYEEDEEEEEKGPQRRRKPWRCRWPDEIRDEVLARLLELNRQRAIEEGQLLAETVATASAKDSKKKRKKSASTLTAPLFASEKGDN